MFQNNTKFTNQIQTPHLFPHILSNQKGLEYIKTEILCSVCFHVPKITKFTNQTRISNLFYKFSKPSKQNP
jgi:hypothetical protein